MAGRRVCLFAHYDPAGRIAPHVHRYLAHLADCGFALRLACSGLEVLPEEDRRRLDAIGARAYCRANAGLDFGAWQHLLAAGCAEGASEVLLANDSVFGPLADLRPVFAEMRARSVDAWGMVASLEGGWHLQSWFVWLTGEALARPALRRVFAQPFAAMTKREIILHGELGLSAALAAERLCCAARYDQAVDTRLRRVVRLNPMHLDWAWLIASGCVPFLKAELVRDNPLRIPWAHRWPQLAAGPDCPPDLIRAHLPAPTPRGAPAWRSWLLYACLTRDRRLAWRELGARLLSRAGGHLAEPGE
jgi:hypothetical protein